MDLIAAPWTTIILVVTCLVSIRGFRDSSLVDKYIFDPRRILAGKEFYRIVSSGFLHADVAHLAFNMMSFYMFGKNIEVIFGKIPLLAIYFGAIIGGSLLSLFIHRHHDYRAYGASGGVCGIIFAHIFLFPGVDVSMFFLPIWIPAWLYAILFLAGTFYALRRGKDNIGHDAHLGGAICGLIVTTAFHPSIVSESPKLFFAVLLMSVTILVCIVKNPLFLPIQFLTARTTSPLEHRYGPVGQKSTAARVDLLLEKIAEKGLHSLTEKEREFLESVSDKYRRRSSSEKPESELLF